VTIRARNWIFRSQGYMRVKGDDKLLSLRNQGTNDRPSTKEDRWLPLDPRTSRHRNLARWASWESEVSYREDGHTKHKNFVS